MKFDIITIFPEIFSSYFGESIIKRAQEKGIASIKTHNLRDWTEDVHKTVDDTPYGGGAGMVMKIEPLYKAINHITHNAQRTTSSSLSQTGEGRGEGDFIDDEGDDKTASLNRKIILLSAKGKRWTQAIAREYSELDNIVMICGRYEGVDERITNFIDEEISIGDYVLTGGELGAMVITDSIIRLLPGVLGNDASAVDESHSTPGVLEYPQYTRPEIFEADGKAYEVPKVLLSGNHKEIEKWREESKKNYSCEQYFNFE